MAINKHFGAAIEDHLRTAGQWDENTDVGVGPTEESTWAVPTVPEYEIKRWVGPAIPQPNEATINGWITTWEAKGEKYPDSANRRGRKQGIKAKLNLTDNDITALRELLQDGDDL